MTKYARRLEANYETIALNRTQVGFSHGDSTFGWRFYPRFQTPDTDSNLTVLVRDNIIGGPNKNAVLREQRLEPGMRECVAIVMMPSFVPYMTVETVSNWFPLTNPKHKILDLTQALKLSRTVQAIKTDGCGVKDAGKYRPGEFDRLLHRADQLEARLPTQTMISPVPILNTLGGFEMFSNGTTDLRTELFGWYGAPGIDPLAPSTTLFLVGDHFSPLRTHVIVGNQVINNQPPLAGIQASQILLSRQVMQVTFPAGAYQVVASSGAGATTTSGSSGSGGGNVVRIHLATPYGVTRELEVPVVKLTPPPPQTTPGFTFGTAALTAQYGRQGVVVPGAMGAMFLPTPKGAVEQDLRITWSASAGTLTSMVKVEFEFLYGTTTLKVPCQGYVVGCVQPKAPSASAAGSGTTTTGGSVSPAPAATGTAATPTAATPSDLKEIVIPKQMIDAMTADLINQIAAIGPIPAATNPLTKPIKSTKVTIIPLAPFGYVVQSATTSDQLTVSFKEEGMCAPMLPQNAVPCPVPVMPLPCPPGCPFPSPQGLPLYPLNPLPGQPMVTTPSILPAPNPAPMPSAKPVLPATEPNKEKPPAGNPKSDAPASPSSPPPLPVGPLPAPLPPAQK